MNTGSKIETLETLVLEQLKETFQCVLEIAIVSKENDTDRTAEYKLGELQAGLLSRGEPTEPAITKQFEGTYALLISGRIPIDIKYKTTHFLVSKIVFSKLEQTLQIEYK